MHRQRREQPVQDLPRDLPDLAVGQRGEQGDEPGALGGQDAARVDVLGEGEQ